MWRGITWSAIVWSCLILSAKAEVESGPSVGEKIPALKVFAVTGSQEGKEVDFAAERKEQPTIYLFVSAEKFDRPMARFMKALDGKIKTSGEEATVIAVWLPIDAKVTKEYLPKAQQSLKLDDTALTVHGEAASPEGWGINGDAHLTAVVVNEGKTAARFGFVSLNETDAPTVISALEKTLKKEEP